MNTTSNAHDIENEMRAIFSNSGWSVDTDELAELVADGDLDEDLRADMTQDAIERYASGAAWREASGRETGTTIDGFPFVYWAKVQVTKGQQRVAVLVVDLDDGRAVMQG